MPNLTRTRVDMALLQADADTAHPIALAPVPGTSLIDYVKVLRKRAWMIAVVAVTITIAATLYTLRMIKIYDAVARINIGRENAQPFKYRDSGGANAEDYSVDVDTQVHILTSDALALQVAKKLHLDRELASAGGAVPGITVAQETSLIGQVKGGLHILAIPNTRLIELRYSDPDPRFAAELLNTLIQTYIDQSRKSRYQSAIQAADWLSKQLADLQVKVETSQEKLVQYQRAHDILGTDDKQNLTTSKLEQLNHEFTSAQSERIQKQALYEWAKNSNTDLPPDVGSDLLTKLRQEQVDIKNELAQLTTQFGANYPKVVALNNRLHEVENSISSEIVKVQRRVENEYYAAQQRERMVKAALDVQKQEANKLNENAIEFSLLKRDAESNRTLYDNLLQQMKEATIAAALNSSNIEVIDAARVPLSPSRPNVPRNVAFGILLGLAMGVASAFVAEMLDMTVRTPEQAEVSATLPVLGIIPLAGIDRGLVAYGARRRRMLRARPELPAETDADSVTATAVMNDPQSAFAESYRALRTSILLSSSAAPPKTILVTSALPKEGKTVTSVNIAISLAQQGRRVLLIDADLRRPSIHRRLRASNIIGLSNVLAGDANVTAAIQPSEILPSLFVVTAGPLPPYPSELLGSIGMRNHLAQLASEYDHVIIDSPPVLSVTDAVIMSVAVNKVVLVIRSGSTTKMALKRTRDLLAQVGADIMGVVMNAARLDSAEYSYGYYYGSRGSYSYASDNSDELRRANA